MGTNRIIVFLSVALFVSGFFLWSRLLAVTVGAVDFLSLNLDVLRNYFSQKLIFSVALGIIPWLAFILLRVRDNAFSLAKIIWPSVLLLLSGTIFYAIRLIYIRRSFMADEFKSDILFYYDYADLQVEYWFVFGVLFSWACLLIVRRINGLSRNEKI